MKLTDWLGKEYGPGDTVIYPVMSGRSVEMQMAEVVDIWTVYDCPEDYKWKRLEEGAEAPFKHRWNYETSEYVDSDERVKTELRVKIQPISRGSRHFRTRTTENSYWLDPDGNRVKNLDVMYARLEAEHGPQYEYDRHNFIKDTNWQPEDFGFSRVKEEITPKAVTLTAGINNITKLPSKESILKELAYSAFLQPFGEPYLWQNHEKNGFVRWLTEQAGLDLNEWISEFRKEHPYK